MSPTGRHLQIEDKEMKTSSGGLAVRLRSSREGPLEGLTSPVRPRHQENGLFESHSEGLMTFVP